jgi:hypothetical protein
MNGSIPRSLKGGPIVALTRLGVTRQSLIKLWLADRLQQP